MISKIWPRVVLALILFAPALFGQVPAAADANAARAKSAAPTKRVKAGSVTINMPEGMTKDQADAILNELRQIRQLLEKQQPSAAAQAPAPPAAAQNAKVNIGGLAVLGRPDAPLTMVEFSDYQCPFCRAFHGATFEQIRKDWIDTGKLRFVSWDLPLEFHSDAAGAAKAARCAGEQSKFWEMRAVLIANAAKLDADSVIGYAKQLPQLDAELFHSCVTSTRYAAEIKKASADANAQGISGTPTFLIGKSNGDLVDGSLIIGAQPIAAFEKLLQSSLPK